MKTSRLMILAAEVLVLLGVGTGGYFFYMERENASAPPVALSKAQIMQIEAQRQAKIMLEKTRPLADKAMNGPMSKLYPRPVSNWKSTEKSIYQKLLSSGQFDVLIVPFQVQEYALDRPTRSLMTAELALAVSATQQLRVPDPYLVALALGDGDRRLEPNEVYSFADKIGVKKIVWGYVGYDRKNRMALSIQLQVRDANGALNAQTTFTTKNFEHIVFSDEHPPIEAYQPLLPEIVAAMGIDSAVLTVHKPESSFDTAELPKDPPAIVAEKQNPARDALYFQVLAYLTPHAAERTKERFAEKSLLAMRNMSQDSPDYRVLKARAFMLLGLRPAALQVLGEPKTPEEKEMHAMLNGNQPEVELYSSQIKPSMKRLIAKLDANYLARSYTGIGKNESVAAAAALKLPGKLWPFLATRAFSDLDSWAQFNNIYLKQLLDHDFPIKDYTLEGMIRGTASLGDTEKLQTLAELSTINHARKQWEIDAALWCCQATIDRPAAMDYLNLITAIGEDNLMRRADFLSQIQGSPEQALELLNRIESVYKDHPQFSNARAKAQITQAEALGGAENTSLLNSAYDNAYNALYWEQGQTETAQAAFDLIGKAGRFAYNFYASDYPHRAYYTDWKHGGEADYVFIDAEAALKNSTANLAPFYFLDSNYTGLTQQKDKHDALLKSVEGRFVGNSSMYQFLGTDSLAKGDFQAAEKYFRESIKVQPKVWYAYESLGNMLIDQGQLEKAAKLFLDYPAFKKNSNENLVGIANSAYIAGSRFYWLGEFSLAKPLYEIASRKVTGSAADIVSRLRLKLIDGHYREALLGSLEQARRYKDTYAYRDYLGMLHAMGESKAAWDAFNVLANQIDDPHIWESVQVGHRKEEKSEAEIAEWVKQLVNQNIGKNSNRAAKYLLRAVVTDRIPGKEIATALADVAKPAWKANHARGHVFQPSDDGSAQDILGPKSAETGELPLNTYAANKSRVKSNLVYFAESYRAIREGNFASAKALLQEASTLYDLSSNELGYLLSYYAFAAAKTGDAVAVEKYMADFSPTEKGFDYFLAQAVIAGIGGKTDESVQFLKSALYKRPFTENRPLQTEYQYAEICKLLFEATGNLTYKEMALDWAKKNQKSQPWFAWAYAMEAIFSDNKTERKRAIAMAFYLDPQSEMLGRISNIEKEIAVKEFKGKNPFLKKDNREIQLSI